MSMAVLDLDDYGLLWFLKANVVSRAMSGTSERGKELKSRRRRRLVRPSVSETVGKPRDKLWHKIQRCCYSMSTRKGVGVENGVYKRVDENWQLTVVRKAHLAIGAGRQWGRPSNI
jgi:hypothetical protein